ncbi:biofilm peroxide resistance protein BsmA [Klebsiella pneumoniae]|nr:biofilm peroxide resistance protein BsmA [Klebsiella pneumoniae]
MVMRRFSPWLLAIVLSGCSALQRTPEAPPPATDHPPGDPALPDGWPAENGHGESVLMYGSPMDVESGAEGQSRNSQSRLLRHHHDR